MRPFVYEYATSQQAAIESSAISRTATAARSPVQYLAGGTTLVDLMKLDVMRPEIDGSPSRTAPLVSVYSASSLY